MTALQKEKGKDFIILNITDPQLADAEWDADHKEGKILIYTVQQLIEKTHPDLITVSGDLAWAENYISYQKLAELLDSFGIPWAPVWGNHDNQRGPEAVDRAAELFVPCKNCIYEAGDPALGRGNYVIRIVEDGKTVEGLIMMDTHDKAPFTDADGTERMEWGKLLPNQLVWYKEQAEALRAEGCPDTTIIMHIPIYAYREASRAAFREGLDLNKITQEESLRGDCWNEGYKDSIGVQYEGICSYPADEGAMDVIDAVGSTKHIVVGHDHVNNTIITYHGVKLIYGLKTGIGCYGTPELNGGTILRVNSDGVYDVEHIQIDISDMVKD